MSDETFWDAIKRMGGELPEDPLPDLQALIDQAIAAASEWGRLMYASWRAYVDAGFTEAQATYLIAAQVSHHPGELPGG